MSAAGAAPGGVAAEPLRVAYQGEPGAFGEQAIARRWGRAAEPLPVPTFAAVVAAVESGEAALGVLPVENSIAGPVAAAAAILADAAGRVRTVGALRLPIRQLLLGVPGATLAGVRTVESHPVALAQCGAFLARHPEMRAVPAGDTGGSAGAVARAGDPRRAAIAGEAAAARYGLAVLAADVQDRPDNRTRFVIVAPAAASRPAGRAREGLVRDRLAAAVPPRWRGAPLPVQAVRGATTVEADDAALVHAATAELLAALLAANRLTPASVISAIFTTTPDLRSAFPARAARELGWHDVPLLCAQEIDVPGALPRCIRVLLHAVAAEAPEVAHHLYLRAAVGLRPELSR